MCLGLGERPDTLGSVLGQLPISRVAQERGILCGP